MMPVRIVKRRRDMKALRMTVAMSSSVLLQPIPLPASPLKGEKRDNSLPFKGRDRVGMGQWRLWLASNTSHDMQRRYQHVHQLDADERLDQSADPVNEGVVA